MGAGGILLSSKGVGGRFRVSSSNLEGRLLANY